MAVAVTSKHASVLGTSSAQTRTSGSASYAAGSRVLLVGHALSDGHTNGLGTGGTGWATPTTNAVTNTITWTQVGSPTTINTSLGSTFRVQSIMWMSSVLTATESFTVTIDAHNGGTGLFFYGINTVEVTGSNGTLVQSAVADDPDGNDTATFGSTPTGFQLMVGYAVGSHDNIVWSAAPTNFTLLSGSTATPNGGTGCAIVTSSTNTATGVTWGWTTAGGTALVTTLILVEITEASSGTDYTKAPADAVGVTDAVAGVQGAARSPADAVGVTDSATKSLGLSQLEAVGLTDSVAPVSDLARGPGDPVGVTDSMSVAAASIVTATEPVGVVDSVAVSLDAVRVLSDALGASDSAGGLAGNPLSDDFNRADGADLGANWTAVAGGMRVDTNTAYAGTLGSTAGVLHRERWDGAALGSADMAAQGTIAELSTGGYSDLRLMVRWTGSTSFYELRVNNAGEWYINRVTAGGETDITSGTGLTLSLPEVWRLEVEGAGATVTLRVYRAGSLLATYGDTDGARITSGATGGIGGYTAGGSPPDIRLDDWSLAAVQAGAAYDQTPADPVGVADAVAAVATIERVQEDPLGSTDAVTAQQSITRGPADSIGVTDAASADLVTGGTGYTRAPADPVGVTDVAATAVAYVRTVADAVGVTDTGTPQTIDIGYDLADPAGVTDATTTTAALVRGPADPVGIVDQVAVDASGTTQRTVADPVGVTDVAGRALAGVRARADAVGVTDSVSAVLGGPGAGPVAPGPPQAGGFRLRSVGSGFRVGGQGPAVGFRARSTGTGGL